MANPLFSTYRGGENRVTSSTVAVFERVDLALVQEILETANGTGGELRTVVFENQVFEEGAIPDARISARFTWWFETKTVRGGYESEGHNRTQLRIHTKQLEADQESLLFVLTPDPVCRDWLGKLDRVEKSVRGRVLWLSFRDLADAITAIITNPSRLVGERTGFLLSELVALYETDGLLTNDDTVIVAARFAWPEYKKIGAYICQPDRSFRAGLTRFGFYSDGEIKQLIPRIRKHYPAVVFTHAEVDRLRIAEDGDDEIADLIELSLDDPDDGRVEGDSFGIMLLSGPDHGDTIKLKAPVVNDVKASTGRAWAWTLGQRHTKLDSLQKATTTSDL